MNELLSHWMPNPDRAPAGLSGLLLVVVFLATSAYGSSHVAVWARLAFGLIFVAGFLLCVVSVVRERSRLFGYLGISASVLYLFGVMTTFLLALVA